ncbi:MAG TPA: M20/M25/M40 family metallo-hydrolase [Steroidobacteraceae bacterium]|nr:M20/M25/M40 family metallo-hydrolase [Steroidobacteraceae bacterium]
MAAARNRGLILALTGIAVLLAAGQAAYRPPAPRGTNAALGAFSAYRAKAILQALVGNGVPHPIGSAANAKLRESILRRLTALGYSTELQTGLTCSDGVCANPVNIIAELGAGGGAAPTDAVVLLAAHYDSVPSGPGASDDGAGVATLLEIARILAALPAPRHRIVLLFTDGEEAGLLGARLFVRDHPLSARVRAAVNVEARGTSGLSLMFETGSANAWLVRLYGSVIARPVTNSLYYVVYKLLQNDTDFSIFKAAGYQGFNFAFIGNVGRYHTPLDVAANASAASIQHQGDNALAALLGLANAGDLRTPAAESVFFDVFGRVLISWPAQWTLPAALVVLILLLAEGVVLLRARAVTPHEALWGAAGALGTLVAGTALCAAWLALAVAVGKVPPPTGASWIAHPLPMHIAAGAVALCVAGGAAAWLAKRAGFWGFWWAAALIMGFLAVACAIAAPGASFILLLAAAAAAVGALPSMRRAAWYRAPAAWAVEFAAILPSLVIFAAAFPLLRFLYMALGSPAWPLSTLALSFVAVNLLPLLAIAASRARAWVMVLAGLTATGGALLTLYLPTYSADWPQRVTLEYWFDADSRTSHYWAQCGSGRLPPFLAAAASFDPVPRARFAGSGAMGFYAAAPEHSLAAPELAAVPAASPRANAGHLDLHLRSVRGAPEALVVFPRSAQVRQVEMAAPTGPVLAQLHPLRSGATVLDVVGLPAAGVDFSIETAGSLPLTVQVFDQSYDSEAHALEQVRPPNTTRSRDGDVTVVHRSVTLVPAAGH